MKIIEKDNLTTIVLSNAELKAIKRTETPISIKTKTEKIISFISEDALARLELGNKKIMRKGKGAVKDETLQKKDL